MYTLIDTLFTLGSLGAFIYGCVAKPYVIGIGVGGYLLYPILMELGINTWAWLTYSHERHKNGVLKDKERDFGKYLLPIVYHPRYNVTAGGIERMHPFDSVKYGRVFQFLVDKQILRPTPTGYHEPDLISRGLMLALGMSKWYLFTLCYSLKVSQVVEVPVCFLPGCILRWRVLDPMMYATQGSIDAGILSLQRGWAINLGGGYHHATLCGGGGFCVYPDITMTIRFLREFYPDRVKKVMIIDLDAHQGNGHERDFLADRDAYIVDMYNPTIYPGDTHAKQAISHTIPVTWSDSTSSYLRKLSAGLDEAFKEFQPSFILYNAGTDCMENDPLGQLQLSPDGVIQRDEIVFQHALQRKIPIVMVLSGGYQKTNAPCIADSIENLVKKFELNKITK